MTAMTRHVTILLPTYNGEAFLDEQLRSIVGQTYTDWSLLVRDDGSSDGTVALVQRWCGEHPNITLIDQHDATNLGVKRSVERLLEHATGDYVMLCDQDDVWLPTKIETVVRRAEQEDDDAPLLVYTDLRVVDANLATIRPTMHGAAGRSTLSELLVENTVTGCTVLLNRPLRELVAGRGLIGHPDVLMHDWWLALVASALGKVVYVPEATILYRQHGRNTVGAVGWRESLRLVPMLAANLESVRATLRQARLFQREYGSELTPEARATLTDWVAMPSRSLVERVRTIRRARYAKGTVARTANLYLLLVVFGRRLRG